MKFTFGKILCFLRRRHKFNYYTDKCVYCGKRRKL